MKTSLILSILLIANFAAAGTGQVGSADGETTILSEKNSGRMSERNREYIPFMENLLKNSEAKETNEFGGTYLMRTREIKGTSSNGRVCNLRLAVATEVQQGRDARLRAPQRLYIVYMSVDQALDGFAADRAGHFFVQTYSGELMGHTAKSLSLKYADYSPRFLASGITINLTEKSGTLSIKAKHRHGSRNEDQYDRRDNEQASCQFNLKD